jgi:hypothetical protein
MAIEGGTDALLGQLAEAGLETAAQTTGMTAEQMLVEAAQSEALSGSGLNSLEAAQSNALAGSGAEGAQELAYSPTGPSGEAGVDVPTPGGSGDGAAIENGAGGGPEFGPTVEPQAVNAPAVNAPASPGNPPPADFGPPQWEAGQYAGSGAGQQSGGIIDSALGWIKANPGPAMQGASLFAQGIGGYAQAQAAKEKEEAARRAEQERYATSWALPREGQPGYQPMWWDRVLNRQGPAVQPAPRVRPGIINSGR